MLEGLGSCVLQLDEIEKGFGGVSVVNTTAVPRSAVSGSS
jgi:hypothetical protein